MPYLVRPDPKVPRDKTIARVEQRKHTGAPGRARCENALHRLADPARRKQVRFGGFSILIGFPAEHCCKSYRISRTPARTAKAQSHVQHVS